MTWKREGRGGEKLKRCDDFYSSTDTRPTPSISPAGGDEGVAKGGGGEER